MGRRKKKRPPASHPAYLKKPIKLTLKPNPAVPDYDPGFEAALEAWIRKQKQP